MRRTLVVLLVVTCVLAVSAPVAHAGGRGAARAAIGLATFAIFAPFIIVGEAIAHAVPPYRAPRFVVAPPPSPTRRADTMGSPPRPAPRAAYAAATRTRIG